MTEQLESIANIARGGQKISRAPSSASSAASDGRYENLHSDSDGEGMRTNSSGAYRYDSGEGMSADMAAAAAGNDGIARAILGREMQTYTRQASKMSAKNDEPLYMQSERRDFTPGRLELTGPTVVRAVAACWQCQKGLIVSKTSKIPIVSNLYDGYEGKAWGHLRHDRLRLRVAKVELARLMDPDRFTPSSKDDFYGSDSAPSEDEKGEDELFKIHKLILSRMKRRKPFQKIEDKKGDEKAQEQAYRTIIAFGKTVKIPIMNPNRRRFRSDQEGDLDRAGRHRSNDREQDEQEEGERNRRTSMDYFRNRRASHRQSVTLPHGALGEKAAPIEDLHAANQEDAEQTSATSVRQSDGGTTEGVDVAPRGRFANIVLASLGETTRDDAGAQFSSIGKEDFEGNEEGDEVQNTSSVASYGERRASDVSNALGFGQEHSMYAPEDFEATDSFAENSCSSSFRAPVVRPTYGTVILQPKMSEDSMYHVANTAGPFYDHDGSLLAQQIPRTQAAPKRKISTTQLSIEQQIHTLASLPRAQVQAQLNALQRQQEQRQQHVNQQRQAAEQHHQHFQQHQNKHYQAFQQGHQRQHFLAQAGGVNQAIQLPSHRPISAGPNNNFKPRPLGGFQSAPATPFPTSARARAGSMLVTGSVREEAVARPSTSHGMASGCSRNVATATPSVLSGASSSTQGRSGVVRVVFSRNTERRGSAGAQLPGGSGRVQALPPKVWQHLP
eukprot:TRINITY_DN24621_c0_g1_i1.p1 TRINITY_DN24621_c0_g1~~TRINITY_DN24621_c0_g1_i1.p1  ORF type:complete len:728 (+),score=95.72 TRINITY_DN24621_c0_g1_i1:3-2186(+)